MTPIIDEPAEAARTSSSQDEDGRRRRRRRGGRGRGAAVAPKGRQRRGAGRPRSRPRSTSPTRSPRCLSIRASARSGTARSACPRQAGSLPVARPRAEDPGEDEPEGEPEVPEYLIAERRQQDRGRGGRGRSGGYRSAIDRERFGTGSRPGFQRRPAQGQGRARRPSVRPAHPGRASVHAMDPIEQTPGGDPWSEVPPEVQELLRAEMARRQTSGDRPADAAGHRQAQHRGERPRGTRRGPGPGRGGQAQAHDATPQHAAASAPEASPGRRRGQVPAAPRRPSPSARRDAAAPPRAPPRHPPRRPRPRRPSPSARRDAAARAARPPRRRRPSPRRWRTPGRRSGSARS